MQPGGIVLHAIDLLVASLIAFAINLVLTGKWIKLTSKTSLFMVPDENKPGKPHASAAGGTFTLIAISMGLLFFEIIQIYYRGSEFVLSSLLALSLMTLLSTLMGFIDDVLSLISYKRSDTEVKGLSPLTRIALMAPISLPLVAIKAGYSRLDVPLVGVVDLGLLYPLVVVPIGVIGASNAFNMLAGYNGLEAGMGMLLLLASLILGLMKGLDLIIVASVIGIAAILAFIAYNKYPARTFPGNSFTYGIGAYFAGLVILGNFEKFGVAVFTLYFVELALFLRAKATGVEKRNFARVCPDGSLAPPSDKVYSVTHIALKLLAKMKSGGYECPTRVSENDVVAFILLLEAIIILLSIYIILI